MFAFCAFQECKKLLQNELLTKNQCKEGCVTDREGEILLLEKFAKLIQKSISIFKFHRFENCTNTVNWTYTELPAELKHVLRIEKAKPLHIWKTVLPSAGECYAILALLRQTFKQHFQLIAYCLLISKLVVFSEKLNLCEEVSFAWFFYSENLSPHRRSSVLWYFFSSKPPLLWKNFLNRLNFTDKISPLETKKKDVCSVLALKQMSVVEIRHFKNNLVGFEWKCEFSRKNSIV